MFKLHFLKSVADVVASLTLDYQLIPTKFPRIYLDMCPKNSSRV
jgi:hypothetical protein